MKRRFDLFEISNLKEALKSSSVKNDYVPKFLSNYEFESVYKTDDDSIVFCAGGVNDIQIEIFDYDNPVLRSCSVLFYENGKPDILYL